jgi:hypothetical protein
MTSDPIYQYLGYVAELITEPLGVGTLQIELIAVPSGSIRLRALWTGLVAGYPHGWDVTLSAAETNTLILTATVPAVPAGNVIEIFDENAGRPIATCTTSVCTFTGTGPVIGLDGYVAFIAPTTSTTLPPAGLLASSNTIQTGAVYTPPVS